MAGPAARRKVKLKLIMRKIIYSLVFISGLIFTGAGCSKQLPADGMIFFYSKTCPHCANVEKYFDDNKVREKIKFEELSVDSDKTNIQLFVDAHDKCSLIGTSVPLLWVGSETKCIEGDTPIIDYFNNKLKTESNK